MNHEEFTSLMSQAREEYAEKTATVKNIYEVSYKARLAMFESIAAEAREYMAKHKEEMRTLREDFRNRLREIEEDFKASRKERGEVSCNDFNEAVRKVYRFIAQKGNSGFKMIVDVDKYLDIQIRDRDYDFETSKEAEQ